MGKKPSAKSNHFALKLIVGILAITLLAAAAKAEELRIEHAADIGLGVVIAVVLLAEGSMLAYLISCMKKQPYSYRNAAMFGGLLFLLYFFIVVLLPVSILNRAHDGELFMYSLFQNLLLASHRFTVLLLPLLMVLFLALSVSNLALIRHEGKNPRNLIGSAFGFFTILFTIANILGWNALTLRHENETIHDAGTFLLRFIPVFTSSLLCYLECVFFGMSFCSVAAARKKLKYDKNYMIILGCAIRKDGSLFPLLQGRVDRARDFAREQEENGGTPLVFVPSGGQGSDECISEAEAMGKYLANNGISEERILKEDRSANTQQNMRYSKQLIEKENQNARVAFVTTNYHVFRAGVYAAQEGLHAAGTGSRTKWYFWPNAFIREFIALLVNRKYSVLMNVLMILFFSLLLSFVSWRII